MNKKILATVIATVTTFGSANAATVYENDNGSFSVIGRAKVVLNNNAVDPDHRLVGIARLGVEGETKVNDHVSVFGHVLYEMAAQDVVDDDERFHIYNGWVGFDFKDFGKLTFGHMEDAYYKVSEVTDIFEDFGTAGATYQGLSDNDYGGRKDGVAMYELDYEGIKFAASYQFKHASAYVNYGVGVAAGYEFQIGDNPLGILAGYGHTEGLRSADGAGLSDDDNLYYGEDKNEWGISLYYGEMGAPGIYAAAMYNWGKVDKTYKTNGVEAVLSYTTPGSDWNFSLGYAYLHNGNKDKSKLRFHSDSSTVSNSWTGNITYNLTSNFQIFTEYEHHQKNIFNASNENLYEIGLIYNF